MKRCDSFSRGRGTRAFTQGELLRHAVAALLISVGACGGDDADEGVNGDGDGDGDIAAPATGVSFNFINLTELGDDYEYEAWLVVDGEEVSLARFGVDASGTPDVARVDLDEDMIAGADKLLLSIEATSGDDPARGEQTLLGGSFSGALAELSMGDEDALGEDFLSVDATYALMTPTSDETSDFDKGIWWYDPDADASTLMLPQAPTGWSYEAWLVDDAGAHSLGRFLDPGAADSDGAGPSAGAGNAPDAPGQDLLDDEVWVVGASAEITVEMEPDNSPEPSLNRILISGVRADGDGQQQRMDQDAVFSSPRGSATLD